MSNDVLIEARGLSRRYGPTFAVADLNLSLRKGEILGLLGPNGAGKSTTMKMLAGVLAPTTGEVTINGVNLREEPKAAKQHLGYLPELPPVYPELNVDEYLSFCAGLHGIARDKRADAVARAKSACGLNDVARRLITNLSKGYQQRVGIAQAILPRPPVVILDEPTIGLDPIQIREIRALITELGQEHSVILSSHILPEIQAVCDRVMVINGGRLVYNEAVEHEAGFESLRLQLRRPPALSELEGIAGVAAVRDEGRGRFFIECPDADPREAIAATAAQKDWGLVELHAQQRTLEEIFVELTSGEQAQAQALAREAA